MDKQNTLLNVLHNYNHKFTGGRVRIWSVRPCKIQPDLIKKKREEPYEKSNEFI